MSNSKFLSSENQHTNKQTSAFGSMGSPSKTGVYLFSIFATVGTSTGISGTINILPCYLSETQAGLNPIGTNHSIGSSVNELRKISGLTWGQLARLLEVSRRTIHFWASGKPISAENHERLSRLLSLFKKINRGSAQENRNLILSATASGIIPLDLLVRKNFNEALELLGPGFAAEPLQLTPLAKEEQKKRTPPAPGELVGVLYDRVHKDLGKRRSVKATRVKKG